MHNIVILSKQTTNSVIARNSLIWTVICYQDSIPKILKVRQSCDRKTSLTYRSNILCRCLHFYFCVCVTRVYFETYQQTTLMLHGLACACAVANKQNKRNFKQMQICQLHILHTTTTQTETEISAWLTGSLGFTSPLQQWQKKRCGGTAAASAIFH